MKAVIHAAMLGEKIDFDRKRVNITFTNCTIISEMKTTQNYKYYYVIVLKGFAVKGFKFHYESHFSKAFER